MHSTATPPFSTTTTNCDRPKPFKIVQRKANYNDKARIRLAKMKEIAFVECGWGSTANVKKYLAHLGWKVDLRLTISWVTLVHELKHHIDVAKAIVDALEQPRIKTGDVVEWVSCPSSLEKLSPFKVRDVVGDRVLLDWVSTAIPLSELELAA